jgi:translation initiation factor IF-2
VDNNIAQKILEEGSKIKEEIDKQRQSQTAPTEAIKTDEAPGVIYVPRFIRVRDFASLAGMPVNKVLAQLMQNGIFTSINEKIDADTASIIGSDLGIEVKQQKEQQEEEGGQNEEEKKLAEALKGGEGKNLQERPPVIVVMGHVDHGKTSLLDTIRKENTLEGESGGITQHIGAYQAIRNDKPLTFIDTPGHEAFTAMRGRGAKVADIAILIVAADDGVKPQTVEAYKIIEAAGLPFAVAINKIDKDGADIEKTKQELVNKLGIAPEEWGGKVICAPISAKSGEGVQELLDMILLLTETGEEEIKADPDAPAMGTVVESHVDKSAGPVATVIIQNGTLRVNDPIIIKNKRYGKIKALYDHKGDSLQEAPPSTPVQILGLKIAPEVGDIMEVGTGEQEKGKKKLSKIERRRPQEDVAGTQTNGEGEDTKNLNLIIKSDVYGSAEAVEEALEKINTDKVKVKIISKGLGNIMDGDINKAEAAEAEIIGFNVKVPPHIEQVQRERGVKINTFSIIYELIDYVKKEMEQITPKEYERKDLGKLKVLAVFKTEKDSQVIGGRVLEGEARKNVALDVVREKEVVANGTVERLQSGKEDVNTVEEGQECGIQYKGDPVIQEGDILQFYEEIEKEK